MLIQVVVVGVMKCFTALNQFATRCSCQEAVETSISNESIAQIAGYNADMDVANLTSTTAILSDIINRHAIKIQMLHTWEVFHNRTIELLSQMIA